MAILVADNEEKVEKTRPIVNIDLSKLTDKQFWLMWHQMQLIPSPSIHQNMDEQEFEPHPVDLMKRALVKEYMVRTNFKL